MSESKFVARIGKHDVICNVAIKNDNDEKYTIEITIDPTVTFENGKATGARLHWSNPRGSTIARAVLWAAIFADNMVNSLQADVIEQINQVFGPGCFELK